MENLIPTILEYRGSSFTDAVLEVLKTVCEIRNLLRYEVSNPFVFEKEVWCTCEMDCGGTMCEPVVCLKLDGLLTCDMHKELMYYEKQCSVKAKTPILEKFSKNFLQGKHYAEYS